jgi:transcriptional regulator with PAS, ATPase and Fis domain
VAVNCAAIPETLLESELFGYERGAFSGAVAAKAGLFEAASGGTLFLDEIGDLPLSVQGKLLRVLETRRVTRIGDIREREVDVRLVAATNRDLQDEVVRGRFRKDLYYRLSGGTLVVPPLRERMNELPLLAQALLSDARARAGTRPMSLAPEAIAELSRHAWPGNVRELKNVMEYLAAAHPRRPWVRRTWPPRLELRAAPANPGRVPTASSSRSPTSCASSRRAACARHSRPPAGTRRAPPSSSPCRCARSSPR